VVRRRELELLGFEAQFFCKTEHKVPLFKGLIGSTRARGGVYLGATTNLVRILV
jgi:hypothetical protein